MSNIVRIKLKAYDHRVLDNAATKIVDALGTLNIAAANIIITEAINTNIHNQANIFFIKSLPKLIFLIQNIEHNTPTNNTI